MSTTSPGAPRVGEALVRRGVISQEQLYQALQDQLVDQSPIGRVLLAQGAVSRRQLFQSLADIWNLRFVDLVAEPPDAALLRHVGPTLLLANHWVPTHVASRTEREVAPTGEEMVITRTRLTVATVQKPDADLEEQVRSWFETDDIEFVITTDWDVDHAVLTACRDELIDDASERLATMTPELSARTGWRRWQLVVTFGALVLFVVAAILEPGPTLVAGLLGVNVMFLFGVVFKLAAVLRGMARIHRLERRGRPDDSGEPVGDQPETMRIPDDECPVYTILVPAFQEANIVAKLIDHIGTLDYPASKLQILLLMEADDSETLAAARASRPPECVRFVVVPPGGPQTKPKACNVGLALAEGEYLVIYDAEDMPDNGQLREVLARFRDASDDVVCLQARLNYFNSEENILTRMFTLEYSFWFDYMLPGLDAWELPIPLGGTSNHFRVDKLRELGGWDPYNVTEDADLGIRAAASGMTIGIIDSTTWEEACSEWKAWIRQRTRWIKGYMVTALVHTRRPRELRRSVGFRGIVGLLGLIAGTPAMFLACPVVWGFWLYTFLGGTLGGFHLPEWVRLATTVNLFVGNGAMILLTALAARRRRAYRLVGFALLLPAYWVLHSIAAWRALYQLVRRPDHWEKTPHGIVHGPPQRTSELVTVDS
ncbi:MAG: glycosyl transferase, group 2 family protein [Ilumatobacteraceae bacterium]|nr:glycosyl transferase, group 2 family protein [Ilumatobacteraceae bacterium]